MREVRIIDLYEAYSVAGEVIAELDGEYGFSPTEWIDYEKVEYLSYVSKPQRFTLLHHYIWSVYVYHLSYTIDKHFSEEVIEKLLDVFDNYEIKDTELTKLRELFDKYQDAETDYRDYDKLAYSLLEYYENTLMKIVVDDIFSVLFQNKVFLKDFNLKITELTMELKQTDYPDLLKRDGVLKRCEYLPQWLKRGVFFRDKGRCQLCGIDLSGILNNDIDKHYDHIVPLELCGTNDPTNFQLTCSNCNLVKGARNNNTKNISSPFWDIE